MENRAAEILERLLADLEDILERTSAPGRTRSLTVNLIAEEVDEARGDWERAKLTGSAKAA